jgi:transaldolase/glucose-6-phosphate isomerase
MQRGLMIPAPVVKEYDELFYERQRWSLPLPLQRRLGEAMEDWRKEDKTERLWNGDASLWTHDGEADWLGWLTAPEEQLGELDALLKVVADIQPTFFEHILLLGMGGSILCPELLAATFGRQPLYPQLAVLDSTDPDQIRRVVARLNLSRTLVVVSSKSGNTLETSILEEFFFEEVAMAINPLLASLRFVAITDPGSPLQRLAEAKHFKQVFSGSPTIGGRYSALSNFGTVPAALMGLDLGTLLTRSLAMVHACRPGPLLEENPGAMLGLILGVAGNNGRDKITLVTSPGLAALGGWIEQLLAESTGKSGKGLLPVLAEELAPPSLYRHDRLFCYLRQRDAPDLAQDAKLDALEEAGQPVVRIDICDKYDLGQEFFRWEFATAVAGSLLEINPFDQPDVESSKVATRQLMADYKRTGSLSEEQPLADEGALKLFADQRNAEVLTKLSFGQKSVAALLDAHLQRLELELGDFFALLAFVEMNEEYETRLDSIRTRIRDKCRVATTFGFGPRYLHSTGQFHKGGPNAGVFLQITCQHTVDVPVPGHRYTFGVVEAAQARGDFEVLAKRNRRLLRVHIGADVQRGLAELESQIVSLFKLNQPW